MNQQTASTAESSFDTLGLSTEVLEALTDVGYERPSPIQSMIIPDVLAGRDVIGQAQTGTGKTAAFALPLLSTLDLGQSGPQVLVLVPTRELAIQVAEAFQRYASRIPRFRIQPIYGGQEYRTQLRNLKRGVHVVVGTPGRTMDHINRGTLRLDTVRSLVLDEADEMLRMGFLEDVEWILARLPQERRIALFSATMPAPIKKIAERYLHEPKVVKIASRTSTAETVRQRYWLVRKTNKLDALTRILEAERFEAVLVFVRTKLESAELAGKLNARGFASEALSGDVSQRQRERIVRLLKEGSLDILVATDVAARGLDIDRVTHVINYDVPFDTESYVHRIGRTGRAGRKGDAILFIAPREQRMLYAIERATKQRIEPMELPSKASAARRRREEFKTAVAELSRGENLEEYQQLVLEVVKEHQLTIEQAAAALAKSVLGNRDISLLSAEEPSLEGSTKEGPRGPSGKQRKKPYAGRNVPERGKTRGKGRPFSGSGARPGKPASRFSKPRKKNRDQ